jgi:DNA-binding HxlR family transcriptional regulator
LGATRFGEIAEQIPEMSDKVLANRLRELEDEGATGGRRRR